MGSALTICASDGIAWWLQLGRMRQRYHCPFESAGDMTARVA
jgi:hypothetical protein